MSQNEPNKLYEQHKRLNPNSTLSFEAFISNLNLNKKIKSGQVKILSIKEMQDLHECNGCGKFLHTSKFFVTKDGYRLPTCQECKNKLVREKKLKQKKRVEKKAEKREKIYPDTFRCRGECKKVKHKSEFYKNSTKRGHELTCKKCKIIQVKENMQQREDKDLKNLKLKGEGR